MKKIQLYNTRNQNLQTIETDVQTWGELKPLLNNLGFDTKSLLATESIFRNDLVLDEAILPDKDFTIFFRQKNTKAGNDFSNMSYKECRTRIADLLKQDPHANAHFKAGKNYTNKGTEELRALLASYVPAKVPATTNSADLVKAVAKAEEEPAPVVDNISLASAALRALQQIDAENDGELSGRIKFASEEVSGVVEYLKERGEKDLNLSIGNATASAPNVDYPSVEQALKEKEAELEAREKALLPKEAEMVNKQEVIEELKQFAKKFGIKK